jgi:L-ascorbate metabolism protein UlaG (beta-lactamase superfamily)
MKVTKYEHSCLVLQQSGESVVIDPGMFTTLLTDKDVVAVVITHEHADHWTPENLKRIVDQNPAARIYGPAGVVAAAEAFDVTEVRPGETVAAGGFTLRFFGGVHAEIHRSIPLIDNIGVLVNDRLYYAGDSFDVPAGVEVDTLAAPSGAPWLKLSEAMDYVTAVAARRVFPVHDMVLSVAGKSLANDRLAAMTEAAGGKFFVLEPAESLDL